MRFFFTATATTEIYTLSLPDARRIWVQPNRGGPSGAKIGRARLASAWQYTSYPSADAARVLALPVTTRRRPTRLSATVATTANAKQQLVDVDSKVIFTVEYAGTDTFRIRVPESIGQEPQITTSTVPGGASRPVDRKSTRRTPVTGESRMPSSA